MAENNKREQNIEQANANKYISQEDLSKIIAENQPKELPYKMTTSR